MNSDLFVLSLLQVRDACQLVVEVRRGELEHAVGVVLVQGGLLLHESLDLLQEVDLLRVLGLEPTQLVLVQGLDMLGIGALAGKRGGSVAATALAAAAAAARRRGVLWRGRHVQAV